MVIGAGLLSTPHFYASKIVHVHWDCMVLIAALREVDDLGDVWLNLTA
jgi:hypothetical protein